MARPTTITLCSFCGKSHAEVKKLIQGPGVYICDNCVVLCKQVLDKELAPQAKKQKQRLDSMAPSRPRSNNSLMRPVLCRPGLYQTTLAVAVHNHYKRIIARIPTGGEANETLKENRNVNAAKIPCRS